VSDNDRPRMTTEEAAVLRLPRWAAAIRWTVANEPVRAARIVFWTFLACLYVANTLWLSYFAQPKPRDSMCRASALAFASAR
jgi:hypothetical protein